MAYGAIIISGLFPAWAGSVACSRSVVYPGIMIATDFLFLFVYLLSVVSHCNKYFLKWDIKSDDTVLVSDIERNENQKLRKALFE